MDQTLGDFATMHDQEQDTDFSLCEGSCVGDYLILDSIGKGGMGEVYRVKQMKLGTEFAMKVLLPESAANPVIKARFEIEARVMAALSHPNIVKVHYFGDHGDLSYMIMDLINTHRGKPYSLEEVVDERGKLPEDEVNILLDQICSALNYMHSYKGHGIVHRDLKPANILLNESGQILITDFGLVKVNDPQLKNDLRELEYTVDGGLSIGDMNTMAGGGTSSHELTMQGAVLGTYDYMAPEIMDGQEASVQSDIYAVGIILYKMLTGKMPRGRFELPSYFGATKTWDDLVDACLASQIEKRPQTVDGLQQLHQKQAGKMTAPEKRLEKTQKKKTQASPKKPKVWLFVLVGMSILLAGAFLTIRKRQAELDVSQNATGQRIVVESSKQEIAVVQNVSTVPQNAEPFAKEKTEAVTTANFDLENFLESNEFESYSSYQPKNMESRYLVNLTFKKGFQYVDGQKTSTTYRIIDNNQFQRQRGRSWNYIHILNKDRTLFTTKVIKGSKSCKNVRIWLKNNSVSRENSFLTASSEQPGVEKRSIPYGSQIHNGSYYKVIFGNFSWEEAQQKCEEMGGHLAFAKTQQGVEFIREIANGKIVWLGGMDKESEGDWRWLDGTEITIDNWGSNQPNKGKSQKKENYLGFNVSDRDGRWHDCLPVRSYIQGYICQWDNLDKWEVEEKGIIPRAPQEDSIWLVPTIESDLVYIKPGTFLMGTPVSEKKRENIERQHEVTLTKPFWIGRYEVTQKEYSKIMGSNPSHFKGDYLPVESVSWYDAMEFCRKLTELEYKSGRLSADYIYTLPTEAQWEYACRAGSTGKYGKNTKTKNIAWYRANSENKTHPVGVKICNSWGLFDMHGNVWEWCSDWMGEYKNSSVIDPKGALEGTKKVGRGGSFRVVDHRCRSGARGLLPPSESSDNTIGFRIILKEAQVAELEL